MNAWLPQACDLSFSVLSPFYFIVSVPPLCSFLSAHERRKGAQECARASSPFFLDRTNDSSFFVEWNRAVYKTSINFFQPSLDRHFLDIRHTTTLTVALSQALSKKHLQTVKRTRGSYSLSSTSGCIVLVFKLSCEYIKEFAHSPLSVPQYPLLVSNLSIALSCDVVGMNVIGRSASNEFCIF